MKKNSPLKHKDLFFKSSSETERELLFHDLNKLIGLNPFLIDKQRARLKNAGLAKRDIEGIASKEVTGELFDIELTQLYRAYFNERLLIEKGESVVDTEKYRQLVMELRSYGSVLSVQTNAICDIDLSGWDQHLRQYISSQGDLFAVEMSRGLPPGVVLKHETKTGAPTAQTIVLFRSTLLDDPCCQEPLKKNCVDRILSRNFNEIESELQIMGRLLSVEEYEDLLKKISAYRRTETTLEKCQRFSKTSEPTSLALNKTKKTIAELEHRLFTTISPKSFELWKERDRHMKEYLKSESTTPKTVEGLFNAAYPQLVAFRNIAKRIDPNPGGELCFQDHEGGVTLRSLEQLIELVENESLATKNEIDELKKTLKDLRENHSCTYTEARYTAKF